MKRFAIFFLVLGVFVHSANAMIIGFYQFNGNFDNSLGPLGSLTPQVSSGTTEFSSGDWIWDGAADQGTGLSLSLPGAMSTYSIGVVFEFSAVSAFRKVVDFASQTSEAGLYVNEGTFSAYPNALGGSIAQITSTEIVLTRSEVGLFNLYVNGSPIQVLSFSDNASDFVPTSTLNFFLDDSGSEFSPSGAVSEIRIWNTALSSNEIPTAFAAVPETSAFSILVGSGAFIFGLLRVRWRRIRL